jgi:hypothetical protein
MNFERTMDDSGNVFNSSAALICSALVYSMSCGQTGSEPAVAQALIDIVRSVRPSSVRIVHPPFGLDGSGLRLGALSGTSHPDKFQNDSKDNQSDGAGNSEFRPHPRKKRGDHVLTTSPELRFRM